MRNVSFASKLLIALILGVATGLLLGDFVAPIGWVGRGFILLLQMAVLPFVSVALIGGLGGLSPQGARALLFYGGGFLLLIWVVVLTIVVQSPLAFPDWPKASYFSAALIENRENIDIIDLYIPSNPFRSLADGVVPAVVVFSFAFGLALMGSPRRQPLLDVLAAAQDALRRVTSGVLRLAPIGIFAIAAHAAGTMDPERLAGLQVFLVTYILLSVLLVFIVLPLLVVAVTPLSYREAVGQSRDVLVTAFATGSFFVVLPLIADRVKSLLEARGAHPDACREVDVIVPISFALAGSGKLLVLVFVLYAGWQSGYPIAPVEYPAFAATGLFSLFAGSAVALPFLLELFQIPADMFQLYLVLDSVIGNRFSAIAGSFHAFALALLVGCGAAGWIRLQVPRVLIWLFVCGVVTAGALSVTKIAFSRYDRPYTGYRAFVDRSFLLPTVAWRDREDAPVPSVDSLDALTRIRRDGVLRVGYAADRLPYAFRNSAGELVGFDIEMAHALARDLNVRVEFFRSGVDRIGDHLQSGAIDVAMTGLAITPERLEQMRFSIPYLQETLAFVVRDHRRDEFRTRKALQEVENLRLAVPGTGYYSAKTRAYLPNAELHIIDSPRVFFRAEEGEYDALVYSAESGSAWTLVYPEFSVAVPAPDVLRVPIGYATARDDRRTAEFIDAWIGLKRNDRTITQLFEYWFEGRESLEKHRRRSYVHEFLNRESGSPKETETPLDAVQTPERVDPEEDKPAEPLPESVPLTP